MSKRFVTQDNIIESVHKIVQSNGAAAKHAVFLILERAPISSFGCLLYSATTGNSVYGNRLSTLERGCVWSCAPLSAAIHVGVFKKCGFSVYNYLQKNGCGDTGYMDILQMLDNNAGSTVVAATAATTLLYCISKLSDIKALYAVISGRHE